MARALSPWFGVAKIGLELFGGFGPAAVFLLLEEGYQVFLDLKLHDIPTTVGRAARVLGTLGVTYTTVHTQGGGAMLEAAVAGMAEGAAKGGGPAPVVLGVTVLTSDTDAPPDVLRARATLAANAGCGGVVCAAGDLPVIRAAAPGLMTVVPGIRPAGADADDQARVATPAGAIAAGASLLVVGRAVTGRADPPRAAEALAAEVAAALQALPG
jgi:orotidine-5'-phosphate decarboxylase